MTLSIKAVTLPEPEELTRTPARSIPGIRDYFNDDVVPAVRAAADDYRTLDTTAPPVDHFPPLLLIVGILVIIYGVATGKLGHRNPWDGGTRPYQAQDSSQAPAQAD